VHDLREKVSIDLGSAPRSGLHPAGARLAYPCQTSAGVAIRSPAKGCREAHSAGSLEKMRFRYGVREEAAHD
jgi:hypothetical protein